MPAFSNGDPVSRSGLLGPNGAGKTTTIEIMGKILEPDNGAVLYKGEPRTRQSKQEAGIQFQQTQLLGYLNVAEILKTFAAFYRAPPPRGNNHDPGPVRGD